MADLSSSAKHVMRKVISNERQDDFYPCNHREQDAINELMKRGLVERLGEYTYKLTIAGREITLRDLR